jgi:hypothetical protein
VTVRNVLLWQSGRLGDLPRGLVFLCAAAGLLIILALAGYGVYLGLTGRRLDRESGRPSPLAVAGVLVGLAAAFLWTVVGLDLLFILWP